MNKDKDSDVSIIPKSDKDITEDWIEKVVGMTPVPNSISVEGNIQDGIGFVSYMCRVSFQSKEHGTQNIIVKLLPSRGSEYHDLAIEGNFHQREIDFYKIAKPRLIEIDPSLEENMCKFYFGKFVDPSNASDSTGEGGAASMLVMEDLRPLGYRMYVPELDPWEDNLTQLINCMARLHCASLTLESKTKSTIPELFPSYFGSRESDLNTFLGFHKANVEKVDALLEKYNRSSKVRAAFKENAADIVSHFSTIMKITMASPCLNHGDLWYGNIMVTENAPMKFIDWQLVGYRNPTTEVGPSIMACLPVKELTRENLDKYAKLYYDTCVSLGNDLGQSYLEFQESFNTLGMAYAYLWYLLAIGTNDELERKTTLIFELLHNEYNVFEFIKSQCN